MGIVWLLLKGKVGADAYIVQKQGQFGRFQGSQTDLQIKNYLIRAIKMKRENASQIYPQPQGKTTMQEISTSSKDRLIKFDSVFARISNCTGYALSVGIGWMVISGYNPGAIALTPVAHVLIKAAQTSVAIGKAGADKSSSVQSEDKN
jgi:hypothetical protein